MSMKLLNLIDISRCPQSKNESITWYGSADCSTIDFFNENVEECIRELKGSFAIISEDSACVELVCDFIRSIPLFYCVYGNEIVVGNNGVTVAKYCHANFDEIRVDEFLHTSYVTGHKTLFHNVYTVLPGEIVRIFKADGCINRHFYWKMIYNGKMSDIGEAELITAFDDILLDVFKDLVERLNGRTALIPLSGGCDSRIIAVMLKRLNYDKVICFSYGRQGNRDALISKEIANILEFPWHFVEYTKEMWTSLYSSKLYKKYLSYSCNGTGIGSVRSFPAMVNLKSQVPRDCIVIPGHTLDVELGSHLPNWKKDKEIKREELIEQIRNRHYHLSRRPKTCEPIIDEWLYDVPQQMDVKRGVHEMQYFEWINRQPKFIANETRKYEFLEYTGWELPFWDRRVCDFVRQLPVQMLQSRYLQYKYMEKIIDPIVGRQIEYFKLSSSGSEIKDIVKNYLAKAFLSPSRAYYCLKMYRQNDMAFFDHMSLNEYIYWMEQCGVAFDIHSITTVHGLSRVREIMGHN